MALEVVNGVLTIDSKADWEELTYDPVDGADLEGEEGSLQIAAGYTALKATIGPVCFPDWQPGDWSYFEVTGSRPGASRYYLRFRVGATKEGCEEADWSEYINGVDGDGNILFDIGTYALNHAEFDNGPWFSGELYLRTN